MNHPPATPLIVIPELLHFLLLLIYLLTLPAPTPAPC